MVEVGQPYDEVEADLCPEPDRPPAQWEGQCPHCGRSILLRNGSGRLWHHGPNNQHRCKGSGADPVIGTRHPRTRAAFH